MVTRDLDLALAAEAFFTRSGDLRIAVFSKTAIHKSPLLGQNYPRNLCHDSGSAAISTSLAIRPSCSGLKEVLVP